MAVLPICCYLRHSYVLIAICLLVSQHRKLKLEYLAVYGRASMGNYYGCAFRELAAFRQRSTHGQMFDPESLYEPI